MDHYTPKSEQVLFELLEDSEGLVRACAADSIGIGYTPESLEKITQMLQHDLYYLARGYSVASYKDLYFNIYGQSNESNKAILDQLKKYLEKEEDEWVKGWYYDSFYELGEKQYLENLLISLKSENAKVRSHASSALSDLIDEENYRVICQNVEEAISKETVRMPFDNMEEVLEKGESLEKSSECNVFLRKLTFSMPEIDLEEQDKLKLFSRSSNERSRELVADFIYQKEPPYGENLALKLSYDPVEDVRSSAVLAMGNYTGQTLLSRLTIILEDDESEEVRGYAVDSFSNVFCKIHKDHETLGEELYKNLKTFYELEKEEYVKFCYEQVFYEKVDKKWLQNILMRLDTTDIELKEMIIEYLPEILSEENAIIIFDKVNSVNFSELNPDLIKKKNLLIVAVEQIIERK